MKIYIAADHRGFEFKKKLTAYIASLKHEVVDVGNKKNNPKDDYPDYVYELYLAMKLGESGLGIVICGSGVGVCVAANRFSELRCGLCTNAEQTKAAKSDDDINVLALSADYTNFEDAKKIVKTFIETPFSNLPRHRRRLQKIEKYHECCSGCAGC